MWVCARVCAYPRSSLPIDDTVLLASVMIGAGDHAVALECIKAVPLLGVSQICAVARAAHLAGQPALAFQVCGFVRVCEWCVRACEILAVNEKHVGSHTRAHTHAHAHTHTYTNALCGSSPDLPHSSYPRASLDQVYGEAVKLAAVSGASHSAGEALVAQACVAYTLGDMALAKALLFQLVPTPMVSAAPHV